MASNARTLTSALLALEEKVPLLLVTGREVCALNASARRLLGEQGQPERSIMSLIAPESQSALEYALAASAPSVCEVDLIGTGPTASPTRLLVVPLEAGALVLCVPQRERHISRLVRQLVEVNAELSKMARELARRTHELNESHANLATLTHDILSPLNAIGLHASLIAKAAERPGGPEQRSRAESIQRIVDRTVLLIRNALDSELLDAGNVRLRREPVSISTLLRAVAETFEPIAMHAGVRLDISSLEHDAVLIGDLVRLSQVLSNLVDNAIRHSPRGGRVTVSLDESGALLHLSVRDEGRGVPAENRHRLFDRYAQGGASKGTAGLGLYIARRLVELHGGRLWLEAREGPGALFVIELPRAA